MNLDDGDSLVDVARIIVEDEVDGPLGEGPPDDTEGPDETGA
jgi:hypothetical protein